MELPLEKRVISNLLAQQAVAFPERAFVKYNDETLTYGEVDARANRIAQNLMALGVKKGDFVCQFMPNSPEFVCNYFGMSKLGAIMVPINTSYKGALLEYTLNDAGCAVLICHHSFMHLVKDVEARVPKLKVILVADAPAGFVETAARGFARASVAPYEPDAYPARAPDVAVSFKDVNCIMYTSGTTGPSKGILITDAHALSHAIQFIRCCKMTPRDVIYTPLPLFHALAVFMGVVAAMLHGTTVVIKERFSARAFWDDVRRYGATIGHCIFSIPFILKKAEPSPRDRDHSLRCMYNAVFDREFEERFGVRLLEAYALTEGSFITYVDYDAPGIVGSCGPASPDWEIRLVDEDDCEVPVGEVGEFIVRPKLPYYVFLGYLNKPQATADAFRNLWFHTGDLGIVDRHGNYYFKGRRKDVIRRRGENIAAIDIENILIAHPLIMEATALPHPSADGEEDVRVVAVLKPGADLPARELIAYCERQMPDFMVPRYVEYRPVLPRTPTDKVEKYKLLQEGLPPDVFDRGEMRGRARDGRA